MKRLFPIAAALALTGCASATLPALGTLVDIARPAKAAGDTVVLEGTRGLIIAHNAYQAAARLAAAAVRTNRLTSAQVDAIEKADARVSFYLDGAGSTLSAATRAAEVLNATNDVLTVLGPSTARSAEASIVGHGHTGHGS